MTRNVLVVLLLELTTIQVSGQSISGNSRLRDAEELYQHAVTPDTMLLPLPSNNEAADTHQQRAKVFMRLARSHDNTGNLPAARAALARAHDELSFVNDPAANAAYYMQLGLIDFNEDQFDDAVAHLSTALDMYTTLNDSLLMASCHLNLGNTYRELGDANKAIYQYNQALYLYEIIGDDPGAAMALGFLGNIFKEKNNRSLALSNYYKALALHRRSDFREDIRIDLNSIGEVLISSGNYAEALPYLNESLAISREIGSETGILSATYNLAVVDKELGRFDKAEALLKEVLDRARAVQAAGDMRNASKLLSEIYERTGKAEAALLYRKHYDAWKDSVLRQSEREKQLRRDMARKARQDQQTAEDRSFTDLSVVQRYLWSILVVVFFALVAAGVMYLLRHRRRSTAEIRSSASTLETQNSRVDQMSLQLQVLQSRLDPAFMTGSLDSIAHLISMGDSKNAALYVSKLSRFLKLAFENPETGLISLDRELLLVESYVQMEQLRMAEKINFDISVDRMADGIDALVPSMILYPFVKNAIWHGLLQKQIGEPRNLRILVREGRDTLFCTVEDNGVGRAPSRVLPGHPSKQDMVSAARLAELRLQSLAGEAVKPVNVVDLKDRYGNPVGTRVEITIPIRRIKIVG